MRSTGSDSTPGPVANEPAISPGSHAPIRMGLILLLLIGTAVAGRYFHLVERIPTLLADLRAMGGWGMVAFVSVYIVACVFLLPGSLLTLGAGAVFGIPVGFALASVSSTLGATASFLVGRFMARDWVARRASANPRFAAIDAAVGREGWRMVGLLRLSPVFPFNLLNYALGLTRVRLRDYVVASWIGMMPGTLLFVWLGAAAGDVAQLAGGHRDRQPVEWVFLGAGLLATVWVSVRVTRVARVALESRLENPTAPS